MVRHGEIDCESWNFGREWGIASMFKIVNVGKFAAAARNDGRREERADIRRWPWWRRLFWLPPSIEGDRR